jgi:hypothetical protein
MQEAMIRKMSQQMLKEGEAVIALKAELAKEQGLVKTLRDKLAKVRCKVVWGACRNLVRTNHSSP